MRLIVRLVVISSACAAPMLSINTAGIVFTRCGRVHTDTKRISGGAVDIRDVERRFC